MPVRRYFIRSVFVLPPSWLDSYEARLIPCRQNVVVKPAVVVVVVVLVSVVFKRAVSVLLFELAFRSS